MHHQRTTFLKVAGGSSAPGGAWGPETPRDWPELTGRFDCLPSRPGKGRNGIASRTYSEVSGFRLVVKLNLPVVPVLRVVREECS